METEKPNEQFEPRLEQSIRIVVEDGCIQNVYASHSLAQVDVEILDLDNAKVSDEAVLQSVCRSIAEAEVQFTKIY